MKNSLRSLWNLPRSFVCLLAGWQLVTPGLPGQTVEVVGSASAIGNARTPVINDAGNVFYVNGGRYAMGNPTTPVIKTNVTVGTILAPGSGDTVPYVLSSNGMVTYITTTALIQSNLSQSLIVAAGNAQATGMPPGYTNAYDSFSKESGVFDYGVAPDDTIALRVAVSSNGFFNQYIAVYAGPATNLSLLMDSFHSPPGLPGYTVDNNGYFHASRNAQGLSLFIGRVYNNANGDNGTGIWLHDSVNGIRLAHLASLYYGSPFPGNPGMWLTGAEFGINHWPAMDDEGRYAMFIQGAIPVPPYTGISGAYAGFENNLQPVATNGLPVPGAPGVYFTNFNGNGPIRMGTGGKIVFMGTIAGTGTSSGDRVLVIGSNPGDLKILARTGAQAPGMPASVVWKQFIIDDSGLNENPVGYPINDQLVMFGNNRVALVGHVTGPGIIGSPTNGANDSGIWVTDDNGNLALLTRRGTPLATTTGTRTVTNYFALEGGSGRDGKPSGGNRVGQLAFANGTNTFRVTYPQPVTLLLNRPVLVGGQVQLSFATEPGKTYYVQLNTNLAGTNWSNVRTNFGDGSTQTNLFAPGGGQGYYRLQSN